MEYQICKRCIMTNKGDKNIKFDADGYCNYCTDAYARMNYTYFPNDKGKELLDSCLKQLKERNKDKKFDCLMGISGGLDSCYLAYLGSQRWGLRIAAVHIDDGFDTEVCSNNIRKLCDKCGIDIHIIRPDTKQYNELTRAYLEAGVPNIAVPQDNILFAEIYKYAKEYGVRDFISGGNFSLESILQSGNTYTPFDKVNIRNINRKYGRDEIDKLHFISYFDKKVKNRILGLREYRFLNYVEYNRERALKEMNEFCGFEYYGSKHLENYFTGFLQLYWMPQKFDVDKRSSHYSSMIVSGQMTRDEALAQMNSKPCSDEWMNHAIDLIKQKLDLSDSEFDKIMHSPIHKHSEFRVDPFLKVAIWVKGIFDGYKYFD